MTGIYGTRARIGIVVPADNLVTEPEMNASAPTGVSVHSARLRTEDRLRMRDDGIACAASLAAAGVDAVAYACSETSAVAGETSDAFLERLAEAAGAPSITATAAIAAQLESQGLRKLVLVTPYLAEYGALVESAYTDRGFEILRAYHQPVPSAAGRPEWWATNRQTPDEVAARVASVEVMGAEAVVLPATNVPTLTVQADARDALGLPVVTGNEALLWWCLEACSLKVSP